MAVSQREMASSLYKHTSARSQPGLDGSVGSCPSAIRHVPSTSVGQATYHYLSDLADLLHRNVCGARVKHWQPAKPADLAPTLEDFLAFETYIFDCDGVIWGVDPADTLSAVETINYLIKIGKRVMFCTNNSNKRRVDFVRELESNGVDFQDLSDDERSQRMICASYTTARYLKENGLMRPFVITSDTGLLEELTLAGITEFYATIDSDGRDLPEFESHIQTGVEPEIPQIISAHPDVDSIVVGWDKGLTCRKIGTAVNYIKFHEDLNRHSQNYEALPIIACSGDASGTLGTATHKGVQVKVRAVGNGAMADAIASCFDPPKEWFDMGKPSEGLLQVLTSERSYNIDLSKALMTGDTLSTDIVFGNRGGMSTLLVLSGVTTVDELQEELFGGDLGRIPTFVLPKLGSWAATLRARSE